MKMLREIIANKTKKNEISLKNNYQKLMRENFWQIKNDFLFLQGYISTGWVEWKGGILQAEIKILFGQPNLISKIEKSFGKIFPFIKIKIYSTNIIDLVKDEKKEGRFYLKKNKLCRLEAEQFKIINDDCFNVEIVYDNDFIMFYDWSELLYIKTKKHAF